MTSALVDLKTPGKGTVLPAGHQGLSVPSWVAKQVSGLSMGKATSLHRTLVSACGEPTSPGASGTPLCLSSSERRLPSAPRPGLGADPVCPLLSQLVLFLHVLFVVDSSCPDADPSSAPRAGLGTQWELSACLLNEGRDDVPGGEELEEWLHFGPRAGGSLLPAGGRPTSFPSLGSSCDGGG